MAQFEFALRLRVRKWSLNLVVDRRKSTRPNVGDHLEYVSVEPSDLRVDASNVQGNPHAQREIPFIER